jgi:hypothetical protein
MDLETEEGKTGIITNEIINRCSKYMNFNEIIEGVEDLSYCIMGNIALYLSGRFASENKNIYDNFDDIKKNLILHEIYEIFDKYIISIDDIFTNLFIVGFFEVLNENERNIIAEIAENNIKDAIICFHLEDIILEYWPRDDKNMPIKIKIYVNDDNLIKELLKNKNNKIELEKILLSQKGLKINKRNINNIIEQIIKL